MQLEKLQRWKLFLLVVLNKISSHGQNWTALLTLWLTGCSADEELSSFRGFKAPVGVHCVSGWPSNVRLAGYSSHFSLASS